MYATDSQLRTLLYAAERLLSAYEDEMLTTDEWDALRHAVASCVEPAMPDRVEAFTVEDGFLVRRVAPVKGEPYQHRCPEDAFAGIAHAIDSIGKDGFVLEDLRRHAGIPWSQAAVAFAFLKERSVVVPKGGREHAPGGTTPFEDAMIEYHALRENA